MAESISLESFVGKMEALNNEMRTGKLAHGEYDQRLARIITELRERKLDAERPEIESTIDDLLGRGVITPTVKEHLRKRLGL
jgi:hypothetical protein